MNAHTVITHALMGNWVIPVAPHVYQSGVSPVRVNLIKVSPRYRACMSCGEGEPLYIVEWPTPGAWWGNTHSELFCLRCAVRYGRPAERGVSLVKADGTGPRRGVSLIKSSDEVRLHAANGGWSTTETRAQVEGWRARSIMVGSYDMACGFGLVLRGE